MQVIAALSAPSVEPHLLFKDTILALPFFTLSYNAGECRRDKGRRQRIRKKDATQGVHTFMASLPYLGHFSTERQCQLLMSAARDRLGKRAGLLLLLLLLRLVSNKKEELRQVSFKREREREKGHDLRLFTLS